MNTYIINNELQDSQQNSIKERLTDMENLINNIPKISSKLLNFNHMLKSDN